MLTPFDPRRGNAVLAAALAEWKSIVREPPAGSPDRIREYLRACGFSRPDDYDANGDAEWCGAFAAWCYGQVGLKPLIRKKHIASTYRLWVWSKDNARRVPVREIQVGDIVVIGPEGDADGAHVTIASTALKPDGTFETYEGNAGGKKPDGTRHEGVIKAVRSIHGKTARDYRAVFAVRPLEGEDYV